MTYYTLNLYVQFFQTTTYVTNFVVNSWYTQLNYIRNICHNFTRMFLKIYLHNLYTNDIT
jgi:hypothetical protein